MVLIKKIINIFRILFRVPYNLGRYFNLAFNAPYSASDKWEIFVVLVSLWIKAFLTKNKPELCSQVIFRNRIYGFSYTALSNLFEEIFVTSIYHFTATNSQPVIVDSGANIGFATLYFKKVYPEATIYAFEPDPDAFLLLKKNIEGNNITGVTLYNEALAGEEALLYFYSSAKKGGLNGSLILKDDNRGVKISARKLSSFLISLDKVDFIKMDVEGAEYDIVEDILQENELQRVPEYIIEYHHFFHQPPGKLPQFLNAFEKHNFSFSIINASPVHPTQQDIIFRFYR